MGDATVVGDKDGETCGGAWLRPTARTVAAPGRPSVSRYDAKHVVDVKVPLRDSRRDPARGHEITLVGHSQLRREVDAARQTTSE
jgi:hypothetical protein